jgi:hypothetical protein
LIILAHLILINPLYPQNPTRRDSISRSNPDKINYLPGYRTFLVNGNLIKIPETPVPSRIEIGEKKPEFFDSLKLKASRYLITRKLYDFVIVSAKPLLPGHFIRSSDADFRRYTGRKIRNIEIRRLGVFGSDINNPDYFEPNRTESILNKTHLKTNEFIIRKNLLFSSGDTISALVLSDNERILRQLPFIEDSRILVVPVSGGEADIIVLTKDVYSLGASYKYSGIKKGDFALFDKNILGLGHEFRLEIPYNSDLPDSPGFGIGYNIDNISKTFINLDLYYYDGLGKKTYGFDLQRKLVSSTTKYAGGISVREMFTTEDLDTLTVPEPLKYNLQDYWLLRSFLINRESVSRIIIGARYTNNNVFDHPFILPDSYHYIQKYSLFLGSVAFSARKFYKTNLIYTYGRTEDIAYGGMINMTLGKEINEFKDRIYGSINLSGGKSIKSFGYIYSSLGISTFFSGDKTEQGLLSLKTSYFSNLQYLRNFRVRNFIRFDYTRGFDRNSNEELTFSREGGFSGFKNDSVGGKQRLGLSLESVLFSPANFYGFRFAFFAFADIGYLFGTNEFVGTGEVLSSLGIGIRIRNDHLVFNTFQIRLGFWPNLPDFSKVNYFSVSGEKLLNPDNFDPGPPALIPFR